MAKVESTALAKKPIKVVIGQTIIEMAIVKALMTSEAIEANKNRYAINRIAADKVITQGSIARAFKVKISVNM